MSKDAYLKFKKAQYKNIIKHYKYKKKAFQGLNLDDDTVKKYSRQATMKYEEDSSKLIMYKMNLLYPLE